MTTLILSCRQQFCRILEKMLQNEQITNVEHSHRTSIGLSPVEAGGMTEVFVISADSAQADRLMVLLEACPMRGEQGPVFELHAVTEDPKR
jgi:hypothetical protein